LFHEQRNEELRICSEFEKKLIKFENSKFAPLQPFMEKLRSYFTPQLMLGLYVFLALAVSVQLNVLGPKYIEGWNHPLTHYNVYLIFKDSFFHLIHNQDLYQYWPNEHWDLYKYSPAFALFMAPFANLPDWLGLGLWSLLNSIVLFVGLYQIPNLSQKAKTLLLLFVLVELSTSLQNAQSNALVVGLVLLGFNQFEKGNRGWATFWIVASGFIKIYGIAALGLALFYPNKLRTAFFTGLWTILLLFLPLLVVSPTQLWFLYTSWKNLLANDHSNSIGMSVQGLAISWLQFKGNKDLILLASMALMGFPFLLWNRYQDFGFRCLVLALLLIWLVIFNHKAESPTFVIAMAGVGLWYFSKPNRPVSDTVFLLIALFLTSLSVTDLIPSSLRKTYIYPYSIKALGCLVIWVKILWEIVAPKSSKLKG
jgi:hypothetical protein